MSKEVTITWYPYPKEKPPKDREEYLVTEVYTNEGSDKLVVSSLFYSKYNNGFAETDYRKVIAWAEQPKPYIAGEEEST